MTRYYFLIEPDGPIDAEGEELPDDAAALQMAVLVLKDITRNYPGWGSRRLRVCDETGRVVEELDIVGLN